MIASQPSIRTAVSPTSSRADSGRASSRNENSLAENLSGVSFGNSQSRPVSFTEGDVNSGILRFDPNSANGHPLGEVNKAKHLEVFFTSLQEHGAKIGNLEKLTQVMNHGCNRDLKNSTIEQGTKVALALFNAVPADMQDKALIGKATDFYKAMDKLSQQPGATAKKDAAYQALKTLTSALSEKLGLSGKNTKPDNLAKFCSDYLKKNVYSDIICKLEGKLSPGTLEGLRKNPEEVVEYLYDGQNTTNNNTIDTLKAQFAQYTNKGDKVMVMYSLLAALEHKTQIIAGLMPDIAAAASLASLADGISTDHDVAQPSPANGNNAAKPDPVINHITNITTNNNYYGSPSFTQNFISTATINLSAMEATTKPEKNQPQNATASKTTATGVDSSTQPFDDVDSTPARPATDNLKPAASVNTSAPHKSLNSSGTLFGTKGPVPSWLDKGSKVTLTNDGLVRDLSQKQSYAQDGVEQKKSTSLNSFGNQFVGFGQQNPAPAPLRGAGKIQQDAPPVSNTPDLSAAKEIPVSDNTLNSEDISETADETKQMPPAKLVTGKSLNAQGTLLGTDGSAPSRLHTSADVITTSGGQVFELAEKQRYAQENVAAKQPNAVNQFGTAFQGMRPQSSAPTALRDAGKTEQASQDAAQVSYKADLLIPGKTPNFISTLDLQVNSDGTLQPTDETYRAIPAQVVVEKQLNAQGTAFGTNGSVQSQLHTSADVITTSGGQVNDLAGKRRYQLGDAQQKSSSSVNAQGNQFVGFGKNSTAPTQSWINNKGANVVLTQEGAQTRSITEKDQYRTDKLTKSGSLINPSEAK
ncbi:hypothetical protein [Yersinia artesiana]|uniref:hypothetical protein n=1 Tax=Yersinia artesiana TaxID=2890315 RepID=UPI001582C25F|nr:hypothetical protein [Yersinia artesiana]